MVRICFLVTTDASKLALWVKEGSKPLRKLTIRDGKVCIELPPGEHDLFCTIIGVAGKTASIKIMQGPDLLATAEAEIESGHREGAGAQRFTVKEA